MIEYNKFHSTLPGKLFDTDVEKEIHLVGKGQVSEKIGSDSIEGNRTSGKQTKRYYNEWKNGGNRRTIYLKNDTRS